MTQSKIDIRNGSLFPWHFQFIAGLILLAGIVLLPGKPLIGFVLIVASGFILTASSGTDIDKTTKKYREYTSFYFLMKSGAWKNFSGVEKIFINSSNKSSTMYSARANKSATFTNTEFNGYLKMNDGTKLFLLSGRNKKKLAATLNSAASFLQVPLQDNTELV